jgi:phage terminase Nu1 subunit (DNA packaging protein)
MEKTATTAELAEIFDVTKKTISVWAKRGLMEKAAHGRYKLKESLRNFAQYSVIVREGRRYSSLDVRGL